MHDEIVEKRGWVDEDRYLGALNFCHLLPGPEAQQLATWIGWRLHGVRGGLAAGLLFVIPGFVVMLALTMLYVAAAELGWFAAIFLGIKAAVLAIVVQALIRIGGRALTTPFKRWVAVAAFVALAAMALPFPLIVLGAGALGLVVARVRPAWLGLKAGTEATTDAALLLPPLARTGLTIAGWLIVWATPMFVIAATLGTDHVLWDVGAFFAQLAVVTFGGAYAVLAYMAQAAVQNFGWLQPGEMADGLGLAETTPGPLILVTQFVGYLAAFRDPAPFTPIIAGILGAGLTVWVTFAPCFLWIFALAPWIDRLERVPALKGGLATLTAAVVGVIASLSLWFALHVLFSRGETVMWGPISTHVPDWSSLDWRAALIAGVAALALLRMKIGIMPVLGICALLGLALGWALPI